MTPRILALDLSLARSGWCRTIDYGTPCQYGVLATAGQRGVERLDRIVREVQTLVGKVPVDLAVLEGYSYGSQGRSVFDIGELGGCVRLLLYRLGVPFVEVPPACLKKYACGHGNAKKIDMVVAARERFGLQGTTDDNECDAYLLWAMAKHAYGEPIASVPAAQDAALAKVAWPELREAVVA